MAARALMRRWAALAALLGLLTGCAPLPDAPAALPGASAEPLPPPMVRVEALPAPDTIPDPSVTPVDPSAPFSEDPADLASALYGDRLIDWVRIEAIQVYAPVTPVGWTSGALDDSEAPAWDSPGAQVGWVIDSSLPGDEHGNIILYGHNNINASVFRSLADLQPGDTITLFTGQGEWAYEVAEITILPALTAEGQDAHRAAYAGYLLPGLAPRLTLISCWPPDNNTHRVIVSAYPKIVGSSQLAVGSGS